MNPQVVPKMRDAYHYGSYGITICAQLTDDQYNGKRRPEEQVLVGPDYPTAERPEWGTTDHR
jgi:hypothetical protein